MMPASTAIALTIHPERPEAERVGAQLLHALVRAGASVRLLGVTASILGREDLGSSEEEAQKAELVVTVGGDGTTLRAARFAKGVPILPVNVGSMGFLTTAEPGEALGSVDKLIAGNYVVSERMALEVVSLTGETEVLEENAYPIALNEVSVEKRDAQRLVEIEVSIDGSRLTTYRADGVLVSSPTGSTGYAMSVHGPLIDPEVEAILIVPVAPHGLFDRAIVAPATSVVELAIRADRTAEVALDGRKWAVMSPGAKCVVGRSAEPVRFALLRPQVPFLERLRSKFGLV